MTEAPRPAGVPRSRGKRGRLGRSAEFERVYRQGRSHGNRYFVLHAFPRSGAATRTTPAGEVDSVPRLGLSVSRKVGGAVERNLVKRLLREAFAAEAPRLPVGQDVVVVARAEARELAGRDGLAGVQAALAELIAKVGASGPSGHAADGGDRR